MRADADRTKQHKKEQNQRDQVHKFDKKVVAKRHDSEMALKDKECNSDKLSMLKEHKEKTKEINAEAKPGQNTDDNDTLANIKKGMRQEKEKSVDNDKVDSEESEK